MTSAALQNEILLAIRNATFPAALDQKGYSLDDQIQAILNLAQKKHVVVTETGARETGKGDTFVTFDPRQLPKDARLTVSGDRMADRLLGVVSSELEFEGEMTLLQALSQSPLSDLQHVQMPKGIGLARKSFLLQNLLDEGLVELRSIMQRQGYFHTSKNVVAITRQGKMAYEQYAASPEVLEAALKMARRQILLNLTQGPAAIGPKTIQSQYPGWGEQLFAIALEPLKTAGIVLKTTQVVSKGLARISTDVLDLSTDPQAVRVASASLQGSQQSLACWMSGRQLAELLLHNPDSAANVIVPTSAKGTKPKVLSL